MVKKSIIIVLMLNAVGILAACDAKKSEEPAEEITTDSINNQETVAKDSILEEMPEFPGGKEMMMEYLGIYTKYPKEAIEAGIEGKSIIEFIVDKEGKICEPKVVKSLSPECDAEAIKAIMAMPKWTPGKVKGEPVRMKYTVPVTFRLS